MCEDLHFREEFSLLQLVLLLLLQLSTVALLHHKQLLSHLVFKAVHLWAEQNHTPYRGEDRGSEKYTRISGSHTALNILGPPSWDLSTRIHLLDMALLKPIFPKESFFQRQKQRFNSWNTSVENLFPAVGIQTCYTSDTDKKLIIEILNTFIKLAIFL